MADALDRCVAFLRRLIATPSLPGEEGEIAALVAGEMSDLGYEVEVDAVGNVIGRIRGRAEASPVMFNTHLDHVDVGDPEKWPFPPFAAEVSRDSVWGRGAVDIKGPMAAQIHGVAKLIGAAPPRGDVYVTCVVQEEIGGVGARHLAATLNTPWVVVGEPSRNTLRRGHRGRSELLLHVRGRSVHASVPANGVNPLITLGRFLSRLDEVEHLEDPDLGPSSVAPTLLATDQTSANVVPGEAWQTLDWRDVPAQGGLEGQQALQALADAVVEPGAEATVTIPSFEQRAYTGETMTIPACNPAYVLALDDPAVVAASRIVGDLTGAPQKVGVWKFATDGGHFAEAGMTPIGFGPGDEFLAHTVDERIEISALATALAVNEALACELAARADELAGAKPAPTSPAHPS